MENIEEILKKFVPVAKPIPGHQMPQKDRKASFDSRINPITDISNTARDRILDEENQECPLQPIRARIERNPHTGEKKYFFDGKSVSRESYFNILREKNQERAAAYIEIAENLGLGNILDKDFYLDAHHRKESMRDRHPEEIEKLMQEFMKLASSEEMQKLDKKISQLLPSFEEGVNGSEANAKTLIEQKINWLRKRIHFKNKKLNADILLNVLESDKLADDSVFQFVILEKAAFLGKIDYDQMIDICLHTKYSSIILACVENFHHLRKTAGETGKEKIMRFLSKLASVDENIIHDRKEFPIPQFSSLLCTGTLSDYYISKYENYPDIFDSDLPLIKIAAIRALSSLGDRSSDYLIKIFLENQIKKTIFPEIDSPVREEIVDIAYETGYERMFEDARGYHIENTRQDWDNYYFQDSEILRCLAKLKNKKNIDFSTLYLAKVEHPLYFHRSKFFEIFRQDKEYSTEQLISLLSEGNIQKPEQIFDTILLLTDLIGAGEALKKINDLIVENRKKGNQEIVDNLERAQVYLVPVKNKKVFAELESFYREFNIKEHDLNKEMTPKEIPLLKQLIPPRGKVLESGCGTGRLLLALKEAGYDIAGYDLLPENVDEVLKEDPEADVSVDDWYETKYPNENFDAVYSLGRNILHEYSLPGQIQLFREAARVLKKGGKFIFDVPDREKGMYAQNIKTYKEAMNREGIRNIREGTVYDSPNGEHFSTRYCFSEEDIQNLARLTGFRVFEIRHAELPTGAGDENLYYVLEKI